ncbi:YraN family protein [candidate division NPL-UPA2 bacterium]|nr:YraN family protein [candidate division NPL-UPA2 bacterium]
MNPKELGKEGEKLACQFLRRKGYRIRERNYCSSLGEIDVVARDKGTLVFVEVKARRTDRYGCPQDSVTKDKQERMRKIALTYLKKNGWEGDCRFDIISVLMDSEGKVVNIELTKNAF